MTFDTPVDYSYHTAYGAWIQTYSTQPLHGAGVENLFTFGNGSGANPVYLAACAYCWIKNIEGTWTGGLYILQDYKPVIRDSFIHEGPNVTQGGNSYLIDMEQGTSEGLVENNIFWYGDKVDVYLAAGGGNVFAYNYTDDSFEQGTPDEPEAGINASHRAGPHLELMEGNYSDNFEADAFWGAAPFVTVFCNWVSGVRAAHPPLNTYSTVDSGNNCLRTYGDYSGTSRSAMQIQQNAVGNAYVGNVLGSNGQVLLTEPSGGGHGPCYGPQGAFLEQILTSAQYTSALAGNDVPMWEVGGSGQGWINGQVVYITRTANWDWSQSAMISYDINAGSGGATHQTFTGTVPNSLYRSAKPAFFGSTDPWPWVDPTTGTTYTLPAMYCFQNGEMPNCRSSWNGYGPS